MTLEAAVALQLGGFRLEADIRFEGRCLAILGASGSGKSLLLKCLAGVARPDRGRVAVNGRVLFDSERGVDLPPQKRRVGFLFQHYALFPRMTVAENIAAGAMPPKAERGRLVVELMRRFRLEGLERLLPEQLSGGQRQRTALARMLAADPETILLDEPFSALDSHLRERMRLDFLETFRERRDVVLVTHSRDEAYSLSSDLLVLNDGRIIARGPTRQVFDDPGHVRVARLTGCKNISRLRRQGGGRFLALDWGVELVADRPVPADARFVGIRAHSVTPIFSATREAINQLPVRVVEMSEEPFEHNVVFRNASADGGGKIWWKCPKGAMPAEMPGWLRLPPEALLFLRGEDGDEAGG